MLRSCTELRPATAGSATGDGLRGREFRFLFAASVVSVLGDVVAAVALTVLIYRRTGSTSASWPAARRCSATRPRAGC
jgi:hypothetical protein